MALAKCFDDTLALAGKAVSAFRSNVDGATSIEYAAIAFFVSILIVAACTQIGGTVHGFFAALTSSI